MKLAESIDAMAAVPQRICLDNYEATCRLREAAEGHAEVVLAIGSERGWSAKERDQFRGHGFRLAHLGQRPLRTETAAIASVSIVAAGMSDV